MPCFTEVESGYAGFILFICPLFIYLFVDKIMLITALCICIFVNTCQIYLYLRNIGCLSLCPSHGSCLTKYSGRIFGHQSCCIYVAAFNLNSLSSHVYISETCLGQIMQGSGLHKIEIGLGTKFQDKFSAWFSRNFMLSGKSQNVHFVLSNYIYRPKNK